MHAPRGNQLRLTRSACLNKVIYLSIYLVSDFTVSRSDLFLLVIVRIHLGYLFTCDQLNVRIIHAYSYNIYCIQTFTRVEFYMEHFQYNDSDKPLFQM